MAQSKIEVFKQMAQEQPENALIRYGLGSEYVKEERWTEAVEVLRETVRLNSEYTAAYQMLGGALAKSGAQKEACRVWQEGIEVATRTGAWKARDHMQELLRNAVSDEQAKFSA